MGENQGFSLMDEKDTICYFENIGQNLKVVLYDVKMELVRWKDSFQVYHHRKDFNALHRILLPDSQVHYSKSESPNYKNIERHHLDGSAKWQVKVTKHDSIFKEFFAGRAFLEKRYVGDKIYNHYWSPDSSHQSTLDDGGNLLEYHWQSNVDDSAKKYVRFDTHPYNRQYSVRYTNGDTIFERENTISERDTIWRYSKDWAEYRYDSSYAKVRGITVRKISPVLDYIYAVDTSGTLTYREKLYRDSIDYIKQETFWNQDTTYYQNDYYHHLRWENDTDNITDLYPYYKQEFFGADSVLVKKLEFTFTESHHKPIIKISYQDSSETINLAQNTSKEDFEAAVAFCGGAIGSSVGFHEDQDSINITGEIDKDHRDKLKDWFIHSGAADWGLGSPRYHILAFVKNEDFKMFLIYSRQERIISQLRDVMVQFPMRKLKLVVNDEAQHIDGISIGLDYTTSVKRLTSK